jgi:hypothetical protein
MTNSSDITFERSTGATNTDRRPLTEVADPVALSCASYRYWKQLGNRWAGWSDVECIESDHEQAQKIRRYYRDRIAMQTLRGHTVSKFRTEMYDICNGGIMRHCHRGMIYKMPYFYAEDTARDRLKELFVPRFDQYQLNNEELVKTVATLQPVQEIFRSRSGPRAENIEYWYRDKVDNLFMMEINYQNPYRALVSGLFQLANVQLKFSKFVKTHPHSGLIYWYIANPEIISP